ncbi:MAG: SLBB domain-containing protein [Alphaproteobacteria bacterium]|nr:SLBB domain-containing protein [Alphaproteobacteria bacterium]
MDSKILKNNCSALLLGAFATLISFSSSAKAENGFSIPVSPWMEEKRNPEIAPYPVQRLSIEDINHFNINEHTKQPQNQSALEKIYSSRIVDELEQYGYDLFDTALSLQDKRNAMPAGMVQDNYVLSHGDSLDITVRGQLNTRSTYIIDSQGLLIVDNFSPVTAAGKTIGELKQELQREAASMYNTQAFVSLSGIRQIKILVTGHVKNPGQKNVTAFHTALDALSLAGGVDETGSLRQIKLVRGDKTYVIDLYQLLMASMSGADKLLKDGDRLIVPPIGPTMAVSGSVKRPAIYEIRRHEKISLHQALQLAGGTLLPGQNRYVKMQFTKDGDETIQDVGEAKQRIFGNGSILMVSQSQQKQASAITLSGHTRQPGTHDLKKSKTLSDLITSDKVLGKDIYPLIGIIERRDPNQLTKTLVEFSPRHVLTKEEDKKLNEGDIIHLFSMDDIRDLEKPQKETSLLYHQASFTPEKNKTAIDDPVIRSFLKERAAFVRGAVRQEGSYPVTSHATLDSVLAIAGGISLEANKKSIEVTSRENGRHTYDIETTNPKNVHITSGDTVRVNQKFHKITDQSVTIIGEVNHPGRYDLMPGDTILKLLERAGGVTNQSYPDGAIFSRAGERKREKNRYKAQAQDLEMKLAASMSQADKDKKPDMTQVSAMQSLIAQLKGAEAVGRITVEADPSSLKADPAQDILLEAGDKIFIPKRPLTVRVAGEVLSPASLQFKSGKDPLDYINEAGGTTYYADKGRAFVVYPDGSASPLGISAWNHRSTMIPPGSTIIVPRDPKPFDFLESAERVSQILANLAISGLYIEAIGDDD